METQLDHIERSVGEWRSEIELWAGRTPQPASKPAAAILPWSSEVPRGEDAVSLVKAPASPPSPPVIEPVADVPLPGNVEFRDEDPPASAWPDAVALVAPAPAPAAEEYRREGLRLLKLAGGPGGTGTELMTAGENFRRAYAIARDGKAQADDIANCGICLWFAALAFFRFGAQLNLKGCKSGAPEELFLTMALKPAEFPGGDVGSRLRDALTPQHIGQLVRLVELAMLCFRKGTELDHGGIGMLWQVLLYRGIGSFPECIEAAKAASAPRGTQPGISTDAYVKGIAVYEADFARLICAPCNALVPESAWLNHTILHSMAPICQMLEGDPSLASAKLENHQRLLSPAAGITLATQVTVHQAAMRDRLACEEAAA